MTESASVKSKDRNCSFNTLSFWPKTRGENHETKDSGKTSEEPPDASPLACDSDIDHGSKVMGDNAEKEAIAHAAYEKNPFQ